MRIFSPEIEGFLRLIRSMPVAKLCKILNLPTFTVHTADLPTWILFPRSSKILSHFGFENPSSFDEKCDCSSKHKKYGIKPSQLTQALTLGFKSQHNIIKISSLFNHSTPKSCLFSFCLDFSYPLNSWSTWMLSWKAQEFEGF